jgi:hypothetical protein
VRAQRFSHFDDFFTFYVHEHRHPANRALHACGTIAGLAVLIAALALGRYWLALLWIPIGYGFAWAGHFLIEKNKPATFKYPLWSFIGDYKMIALMLTGRLK